MTLGELQAALAAGTVGAHDPSLDLLSPDYVSDRSSRRDPLAPAFGDDGYAYFGGKETDPASNVIIAGKGQSKRGERAVVRVDGTARLEKYSMPLEQ